MYWLLVFQQQSGKRQVTYPGLNSTFVFPDICKNWLSGFNFSRELISSFWVGENQSFLQILNQSLISNIVATGQNYKLGELVEQFSGSIFEPQVCAANFLAFWLRSSVVYNIEDEMGIWIWQCLKVPPTW
jgi:hypothetical protein